MSATGGPFLIQMRGLPYNVRKEEILGFLELRESEASVDIVSNPEGGMFGAEAVIHVMHSEEVAKAISKNGRLVRDIPVQVEAKSPLRDSSADEEGGQRVRDVGEGLSEAEGGGSGGGAGVGGSVSTSTTVLRLRGLPFRSTQPDVVNFFDGFTISGSGIQFVFGLDGRPTGECYVEFLDERTAAAALSAKQRAQMGARYIELFPSTKAEMDRVVQTGGIMFYRGGGMGAPPPAAMMRGAPMMPAILGSDFVVRLRGLPYSVTDEDVRAFFRDITLASDGVHFLENASGRFSGDAFVELPSSADVDAALAHNRQYIGARYVEVFRTSKEEMMMSMGQYRGGVYGRGRYGAPSPPFPWGMGPPFMPYGSTPTMMTAPPGGPGMPSVGEPAGIVKLRGVPYEATLADVAQFFDGYGLICDTIRIIPDARGRPSGEAWVQFSTYAEATRAVRDLHRHKMGSRSVELYLNR